MTHTVESLIAFRDRVADAFRDKRIRCPVHFPSDTQAEPLIEIFKDFRPGVDYCFSGWRSMWHALLAGIPEDELFQMILDGRSMFIMDKERRVFCSSIVGGILPIALGVAAGIKRQDDVYARMDSMWATKPRVWVFVGDMTARTGLYNEFTKYLIGHSLPVRVVIEDNGLSTNTPTAEVWTESEPPGAEYFDPKSHQRYPYTRTHPHVGLSERVNF